jgi:spermidine synthase
MDEAAVHEGGEYFRCLHFHAYLDRLIPYPVLCFFWYFCVNKLQVATTESIFQRIEIFDLMNPKVQNLDGYRQSLISSEESYEASLPELFKPDRLVFLDGVVQSSSRGDEPYHEALVQPAMFAHPNPRRVAIIGGGEGATLREVLKHKSVEHVKMIDIDEVMVKFSAEHIPAWSDCSDVQGSSESCFDDKRADVLFEDAMAWFINRFVDFEGGVAELFGTEEKFDVVIMDALDPQDTVVFANMLYNSDIFLRSLKNGLTDDGVLVMQLGEVSGIDETAEDNQHNKNRASVNRMIVNLGFESMHIYDEVRYCDTKDLFAVIPLSTTEFSSHFIF